jgi:pimeloyl-ACP methyl ester carboxylesterase/DNA-binding CsgD family transcriptional regulator
MAIWVIWLPNRRGSCHSIYMESSTNFFDRFCTTRRNSNFLSLLVDDPEGRQAAIKLMPNLLGGYLDIGLDGNESGPIIVSADCFMSAACNQSGDIIAADARFLEWSEKFGSVASAIPANFNDKPRISLLTNGELGPPTAIAVGTLSNTKEWPLAEPVRRSLQTGLAQYACIVFLPGPISWERPANAYALTPGEVRLVVALTRLGNLKLAAKERNISYETARKFLSAAMRKTGTKRQSELIYSCLSVASGDMPKSENLVHMVGELYELTERQSRLAILMAGGASRDAAAEIVKISSRSARGDLERVYENCNVNSATDLARSIMNIDALRKLSIACTISIDSVRFQAEQLRFIKRRSGSGKIAIVDHGPVHARPVLLFHSNTSGRHHARSLVAALRNAGFRPIAVERAGYGLSDSLSGDPVANAVSDVVEVLDALGIQQASVLARSTTASLVACAAYKTGHILGGVLLTPDPPIRLRRSQNRFIDHAKNMVFERPKLARAFANMICHRVNDHIIELIFRSSVSGNALDQRVLDDEAELADMMRGAKQCIVGMEGFINEAIAYTSLDTETMIIDTNQFILMFGLNDRVFAVNEGVGFWSKVLPNCKILRVKSGGHFLHITHNTSVIEQLQCLYTA